VNPNCTPAGRITRSLLGYGIIAGPLYVVVALAQALDTTTSCCDITVGH
jgi:hypothetical protein